MINGILKRARSQYDAGKNGLIGKHIISITPESLCDVTEVDKSDVRWDGIEQIITTDKYLLVVKRPSSVFVIPGRAFSDDSAFNKFVETVKKYHKAATTSVNTP